MASVNRVTILGNLGRDPEIRYLPSGDAIANIAVATSFKSKDKNTGEQKEQVEWHRIVFFGRLAEVVGQYTKKGSPIYVEGRLQTRKYTDKDGIERYATEIVGENMQLLGSRGEAAQDDGAPVREQARGQGHNSSGQRNAYADQKGNGRTPPQRQASDFDDSDIPF